jgi:hypothetical protein
MFNAENGEKLFSLLKAICGGWWSLMSGAISIPLAFLAVIFGGKAGFWFGVLAFVALWVLAIRLAWRNYPKIRLSCNKDIQGCAVLNDEGNWKLLRLLVETDCVTEIENCLGHLTKIEKGGVVVFEHESRELPFAPSETEDSLSKMLFQDTPYFLDILAIHTPRNLIFIATKGKNSPATDNKKRYIFSEMGEYVLTVSVSGKRVPTQSARLKLDWRGNWDTATIEKIDVK